MTRRRVATSGSAQTTHRAQAKSAGLGKIPSRKHRRLGSMTGRRFRHWEGDTLIHGHKQSGLVTLVERRSGYLLAARLPRIWAELTQATMIRLLKPHQGAVQTITLDNGSEFASHGAVAKAVTVATYFCDPYYFWATWEQREQQWPDTAVFSQGNRLSPGHLC
ncbi:hypothetical protein C1H69_16840 [Billgrantia endophytica]|uniref:Integrase catalytic domain-containing protein n=1 Tax=Billgrantia endophytica TaxID=2033802 RepID=A0A2N7TZG7_9GAMM|nr:hypothetical protein C1H69_16840 [Halomonas endophytica]